jgi:hypothetical protein
VSCGLSPQYYSLAATSTIVYGWGSNAYLSTGTGTDKGAEVLQPTTVMGPLGSGEWTIHALTAGYQHALAIADLPGSAAAAKLRADALAAAAADGSGPQPGTIEVVLTEQQKRQQKEYQEAQHDVVVIHPVLHPRQQDSTVGTNTTEGVQQDPAQTAVAGQQQAADSTGATAAPPVADSAASSAGSPAGDYHWSYLARQPGPGALRPHEVWSAWKPSPWHDALAALSADVFKLLPQQYNTIHTNPCWGGTGPQLACLPHFNIIGVSKCGTTDLYHRLSLYKQVILPATNKVCFVSSSLVQDQCGRRWSCSAATVTSPAVHCMRTSFVVPYGCTGCALHALPPPRMPLRWCMLALWHLARMKLMFVLCCAGTALLGRVSLSCQGPLSSWSYW